MKFTRNQQNFSFLIVQLIISYSIEGGFQMNIIGDYHIHSPFCPHGSNDSMESYVRTACEKGLHAIGFTEHAPLPLGFNDPTPEQDSAMQPSDVESYLREGKRLKEKYKKDIVINVGFEVDYIQGFEKETQAFLDAYGVASDQNILSVHMINDPQNNMHCLDYSAENFEYMVGSFGSIDNIYRAYFHTLLQSIEADLGIFKPKRIGHITLVHKFQKRFAPTHRFETEIGVVLDAIKQRGYQLDLNSAGLFKEDCQELYPADFVIDRAVSLGIPLVPGSDSHEHQTIARGFEHFKDHFKKIS